MSTPSIEDVIAQHRQIHDAETGASYCDCGYWQGPFTRLPSGDERAYSHHLADAIRAHLAERTDEAAGAVERVRKLADEWAEDIGKGHEMNPNGHYALSTHERDLDELRAALAGGASGAAEEADQ